MSGAGRDPAPLIERARAAIAETRAVTHEDTPALRALAAELDQLSGKRPLPR
jgi:hypothetical protein